MTSNVNLLSSQAIQQPGLPHSSQQHRGPAVHSQAVSAAAAPTETVGWVLEQHYDILGKIGEGTYGVVYLATSKRDKKQLYAIKKFKTGREGDGISPTAVREIMLLRELNHEHIVKLTAVHINRSEPSLSLAFQYAEHDLYEIIWHHRDRLAGPIDPYVVKSVMWQLLNGLSYLHQNWIIHRDLKPSNILVMGEGPEAGQVKVGDFGLARFFQAPLKPLADNGVVVTIWYRPPELLLGGLHYTRAVDMWGAGCIFAELLTLRPLFQGQERKQPGAPFQFDQLDRIFKVLGHPTARGWPLIEQLPHWANNKENIRVKKPDWGANRLEAHLSEVLRHLGEAFARAGNGRPPVSIPKLTPAGIDLLQQMLVYDPSRRITAEEALQHPYFQETPRPGPNAFVCEGKRVASYPRRHKQTAYVSTAPAAAVAGASGGAVTSQQHTDGQTLSQQHQQRSQQQTQQLQRQPPQRTTQSQRTLGQQQQAGLPAVKKRKAEIQGRRSDGHRGGPGSRYTGK